MIPSDLIADRQVIRQGFVVAMVCCLWNLIGDWIYAPMGAAGHDILSTKLPYWISHTTHTHATILLAQTAGWMYPVWGYVTAWQLTIGLRPAGKLWASTIPCLLMAYSFCVIGGAQHSGWAFLTVLWQQQDSDDDIRKDACNVEEIQARIWNHFLVGDLPAILLFVSSGWILIILLMKQTHFSWWFPICTPLVTQIWVMGITYFLPAPYAGIFGGPFGTWMIFTTNLGCAIDLWNHPSIVSSTYEPIP